MWQVKTWKFKSLKDSELARERANKWLARNEHKIEWHQIFVANAWGIEYRKLRRVY